MTKTIHRAETRGYADHGWLKSFHTFSFASYYEPSRIHFGMLRVLNDDSIAGGTGFGTHPHDNMEIVSIPISGALEHKDSTGRHEIIKTGEVQIMSAGSGIRHSEYNASKTETAKFLQIWVMPKERNIEPQYGQKNFGEEAYNDNLKVVVSPEKTDDALWINQDAWFSLGNLKAGKTYNYASKRADNGAYFFVMEGEVTIAGEKLGRRDAMGITDFSSLKIEVSAETKLLVIDIPMHP